MNLWGLIGKGYKQIPVILSDTDGKGLTLEDNGSLPVTLQDSTNPIIMVPLRKETRAPGVLTADSVIDTHTITVDDATGVTVGMGVLLRSVADNRFSHFHVLAINSLTLTLDSPMDFVYTVANTTVNYFTENMAVDGSVTPQIFSLRAGSSPQIPTIADVTRIIIACETATAPALNEFGDIPALAEGCVLRHKDGAIRNLFNIKSNLELANISYDLQFYSAIGQGANGFVCRLTFAGQEKMGSVLRVAADEDLEFQIHDNLTGLTKLGVFAEGHVVSL